MVQVRETDKLGAWPNVRRGLRMGLALATLFSAGVAVLHLTLGAQAFERFGIGWLTIIAAYYAALPLGGCAYGALLPLKRRALGAMLLGFVLVLPIYACLSVLLGLILKRVPSLQVGLLIGLILAAFVGGGLGLSLWMDDRRETRENGDPVGHSPGNGDASTMGR